MSGSNLQARFLGEAVAQLELRVTGVCKGGRQVLDLSSTMRRVDEENKQISQHATRYDPRTAIPSNAEVTDQYGKHEQRVIHVFYDGWIDSIWPSDAGSQLLRFLVPDGEAPHDPNSLLVALRSWQAAEGESAYGYFMFGWYLWRADFTYRGLDELTIDGTDWRALRFSGVARPVSGFGAFTAEELKKMGAIVPGTTNFGIWFSEDERRVPLKLALEYAFGDLELVLRSRKYVSRRGCEK